MIINQSLIYILKWENHYEGFNKGVKEVLKNKNLQGIQGALGQVIEVPSKFEKVLKHHWVLICKI